MMSTKLEAMIKRALAGLTIQTDNLSIEQMIRILMQSAYELGKKEANE